MSEDANTSAEAWRCTSCGALLGRHRDGSVEIRIKHAVYWTSGMTRARCGRCGTTNTYAPSRAKG